MAYENCISHCSHAVLFLLSNLVYLSFGLESFFWNKDSSYSFPTLTSFIGSHIFCFSLPSLGILPVSLPGLETWWSHYWSSSSCSLKVHVSQMDLAREMLRKWFSSLQSVLPSILPGTSSSTQSMSSILHSLPLECNRCAGKTVRLPGQHRHVFLESPLTPSDKPFQSQSPNTSASSNNFDFNGVVYLLLWDNCDPR